MIQMLIFCFAIVEKTINDFTMVPQMQLSVAPLSRLYNASVAACSAQCTFMEAFVCRSFDFLVDTNTCLFYKENMKDKIHIDIKLLPNPNCTHYSSSKMFDTSFSYVNLLKLVGFFCQGEYMVENGMVIPVEAIDPNKKGGSDAGLIAGVVIAVFVGSALLGAAGGFLFKKYYLKRANLPSMSFRNPNLNLEMSN